VPYILVERVKYAPISPWPSSASGTGDSLNRIDDAAYADDPANWMGAEPSPGQHGEQSGFNWHLSIAVAPGGTITVRATGTGTGQVILQSSFDLILWSDLASRSASEGSIEFSQVADGNVARYYRAVLVP
jgi:hypothetical protein